MSNFNRPSASLARWIDAFANWLDRWFVPAEPLTTETPAPIWLVAVMFALCPPCYFIGAAVIGGMFAGVCLEASGRAVTVPPGAMEARASYLQIANFYHVAEARAVGSLPGFKPGDLPEDEARIQADTWHAMADEIGEDVGDL